MDERRSRAGTTAALGLLVSLTHTPVARAQCVTSSAQLDCCTGFSSQPSYDTPDVSVSRKCLNRPADTVCYAYLDHYVWLLPIIGDGYVRLRCAVGDVDVIYNDLSGSADHSDGALRLHILGTDLVKTFSPCSGEADLDPEQCTAQVLYPMVYDDGGVDFFPRATDAGTLASNDGGTRGQHRSDAGRTTTAGPTDAGATTDTGTHQPVATLGAAADDGSGCGCRVVHARDSTRRVLALILGGALVGVLRRRRKA